MNTQSIFILFSLIYKGAEKPFSWIWFSIKYESLNIIFICYSLFF